MKLTDAEVKHMRLTLAWLRTEYCLDEDMQRGALLAVRKMLDNELSHEQAHQALTRQAARIEQVPKYVRQAVKMLTKALREHDGQRGEVVDVVSRDVQEVE
jgi:lactam utilization protein B